jgi:hypothetical protein
VERLGPLAVFYRLEILLALRFNARGFESPSVTFDFLHADFHDTSSKTFDCDITHDYFHNNISSGLRRCVAAKDNALQLRCQSREMDRPTVAEAGSEHAQRVGGALEQVAKGRGRHWRHD